jgi:hypothetical protein
VNGAFEWARIEALLVALGCEVTEKESSAVMFSRGGVCFQVRLHPRKEALRYQRNKGSVSFGIFEQVISMETRQ